MPAARYDITIEQGATFRLEFTIKQGGVAVDLTGYAARAQGRRRHSATTADWSVTSEAGGGITLGGAAGTVAIVLDDATTAALSVREEPGVWDFELEAPDGEVTRELEGLCIVSPEVTR